MIITADLGNTALKVAVFEKERITASFSLSSLRRTADEWRLALSQHFADAGIDPARAEGSILGSVVPPLTDAVRDALARLTGKAPLAVAHGIKTGLDIRTDHQAELGADIVANAVGARLTAQPPFVVVDFGTATTVSAVDEKGAFRGVAILPGVGAAAAGLARTCASLPEIIPGNPAGLLGKNTHDSLNGGISYGFAALADGLTDRVLDEIGGSNVALFATGGAAEKILPLCKKQYHFDPYLTAKGLARLYEINRVKKV